MGLNYSFSLIVKSEQIDLLLRELVDSVSELDARRLSDAIPWKPEIQHDVAWGSGKTITVSEGIAGLSTERKSYERQNDYCFSFLFPFDIALKEYGISHNSQTEGDRVSIGCIWTSLYAGSKYALFEATAATTKMSELFSISSSVRNEWIKLAGRCRALALYFDPESESDWLLLYPESRICPQPFFFQDSFWSPDFEVLRVDEYCWEALHLSQLT